MKKMMLVLLVVSFVLTFTETPLCAEVVLEPFTYSQDFETRELSAWASYPIWQDTAYDPNFRVNTIVPGDPNISIEQTVTPYTNVDNYAGAQKKLDMYMVPGSTITLRYYLKTHLPVAFFKIRLAAGPDGKVDCTVKDPPTNRWVWLTVTYNDFLRENPSVVGRGNIKVNALAVLTRIPDGDPDMPLYLGLDDVVFKGARVVAFQFMEPGVFKLSEWKPYIPEKHYSKGDTFTIRGRWPLNAKRVTLTIVPFTNRSKTILQTRLKKRGDEWSLSGITLSYPEGLYHATLQAQTGKEIIADTEFTLYIVPQNLGGNHPRLWFDSDGKMTVANRLKSEKFKDVFDDIVSRAQSYRKDEPVEKLEFDVDQFPDEDWIPTLSAWSSNRIHVWRAAVYNNVLAYAFNNDMEAGEYAKDYLVKLSTFPYWLHPWMIKRGRHIYYPIGLMGMDLAVSYDLLYNLMDENERKMVRDALMKNVVIGCHKGYVEDDLVTNNTSNWVAHITGGSLLCQAAMYGDGSDVAQIEPYFTGAIFKDYDLVQKALGRDGAYGEGYGYYNFTMDSWLKTMPVVENVFKIDMSEKINGSYKEIIWAGLIKDKQFFYFGDSGGNLRPLTNWAWLIPKYKDPLLGWLYNFMKRGETFMDVLYNTEDIQRDDPFDENPVRLFRDVGTTVFKSGWEKDDFVFVMRTGAFYNHQHLDQGSFWLSDHGSIFFEERHGSSYYSDPLYQSWYTQPIAHSTILIDNNHQSQRAGDPLVFAEGFHDHAFVTHFLDGSHASFSSGDIGRLYWGKVNSLKRNVLYLKPRTLLMLDTVVPAKRDVDVTLLYQTQNLRDITAGSDMSMIIKDSELQLIEDPNKFRGEVTHYVNIPTDKTILFIKHLFPDNMQIASVETPHYLNTLLNQKPLVEEGMLTVTARTSGNPLVIANLLMTTIGEEPDVSIEEGDGFITGTASGTPFAFPTRVNTLYEVNGLKTDALAVSWKGSRIFAAMCTSLMKDGIILVEAEKPVTCEVSPEGVKYYHCQESEVALGVPSKPGSVTVNGRKISAFEYNAERKAVMVVLPAGEGLVTVE